MSIPSLSPTSPAKNPSNTSSSKGKEIPIKDLKASPETPKTQRPTTPPEPTEPPPEPTEPPPAQTLLSSLSPYSPNYPGGQAPIEVKVVPLEVVKSTAGLFLGPGPVMVALGLFSLIRGASAPSTPKRSSEFKNVTLCQHLEDLKAENKTLTFMNDVDCSNKTQSHPLAASSTLDGAGHTVNQLSVPLFSSVSGQVRNLIINGGHFNNTEAHPFGALARTSNGTIDNVTLANSILTTTGSQPLGGIVGHSTGGSISNTRVINATLTGANTVGGTIGLAEETHLANMTVERSSLSVSDARYVGGGVGNVGNSNLQNIFVSEVSINSTGSEHSQPKTGGVVGNLWSTEIRNHIELNANKVSIFSDSHNTSRTGGIAGKIDVSSKLSYSNAVSGSVSVSGSYGKATGLLIGQTDSCVAEMTAVNMTGSTSSGGVNETIVDYPDLCFQKPLTSTTCTAESFKGSPFGSDCSLKVATTTATPLTSAPSSTSLVSTPTTATSLTTTPAATSLASTPTATPLTTTPSATSVEPADIICVAPLVAALAAGVTVLGVSVVVLGTCFAYQEWSQRRERRENKNKPGSGNVDQIQLLNRES